MEFLLLPSVFSVSPIPLAHLFFTEPPSVALPLSFLPLWSSLCDPPTVIPPSVVLPLRSPLVFYTYMGEGRLNTTCAGYAGRRITRVKPAQATHLVFEGRGLESWISG